jgi:hypothetical protein
MFDNPFQLDKFVLLKQKLAYPENTGYSTIGSVFALGARGCRFDSYYPEPIWRNW